MHFLKRLFSPGSIVYILAHLLLVVLGYTLVLSQTSPSVGTSLIAAGITGLVVFVYIRFSESRLEQIRLIDEFGIVSAFDARAARIKEEYDLRLKTAREIDILGFGLKALRQDYQEDFGNWAVRCRVRILLIDPSAKPDCGSHAQQRDLEEGDPPGTIEADVQAFLNQTKNLREGGHKGNFEVRLYHSLPAINVCRIDDDIFWGPYLVGGPSRNSPTLVVRKGGKMYTRLKKHFDLVWDNWATPV